MKSIIMAALAVALSALTASAATYDSIRQDYAGPDRTWRLIIPCSNCIAFSVVGLPRDQWKSTSLGFWVRSALEPTSNYIWFSVHVSQTVGGGGEVHTEVRERWKSCARTPSSRGPCFGEIPPRDPARW